ncbi:MAG: lysophospholipase [Burkholderiales bacterium]|nr:lysophospholipase [Burkholderiales bacterium]
MPTLQTSDGLALQLRDWPVTGSLRGTVLIVHGLGEHIGRYAHVAAHLNACGWQVFGHDQRGHGNSAGARGAIVAADSLLEDLALVIDTVRAQATGPLVLLGHSMGGLVAGRFVAEGLAAQPARWHRPVEALVMSSPALALPMNVVQRGLLAVLGSLAPDLALGNGLKPAWISRDAAVVQAYQTDPLVHDRVTARLVRFLVDGGALVRERAARWQVPTALLYAGADRCVDPRGSDAFATTAPKPLVQVQRYEGLFHEIFNEPEKPRVLDDLARWLATHGASNA